MIKKDRRRGRGRIKWRKEGKKGRKMVENTRRKGGDREGMERGHAWKGIKGGRKRKKEER